MTFKEYYLSEAKQIGFLYHYTTIGRAIKILESNVLKSGSRIASKNYPYFGISTTRDKFFHKKSRKIGGIEVRFVLDGNKISNNHKIRIHHDKSIQSWDKVGYESEEFIHGKILNISNYILSIEITGILDGDSDYYKKDYKEKIQKLISMANLKGIKVNNII